MLIWSYGSIYIYYLGQYMDCFWDKFSSWVVILYFVEKIFIELRLFNCNKFLKKKIFHDWIFASGL